MAIDTSKIENYANMTPEEKVAALEQYEMEAPKPDNAELTKLKDALSKANGQAAEFKRALREKQTEQERLDAEREESNKALMEELNAYRVKDRISGYKDKLVSAGYDTETAAKMAANLPEGVSDEFFASQKAFIEAQKKTMETELMKKQGDLTPGQPPKKDQILDPFTAAFRKSAGV